MNASQIMETEDFKRCADFHGHICPGMAMGYRASKAGMDWLKEQRAEDEEIVAVVETDACSADAVQVLTGCTFGKGNFIFKDYGKMALTLFSRKTGKGVRVVSRPDAMQPNDKHMALIQKIRTEEATEEEQAQFKDLHFQRTCSVLEAPEDELFILDPVEETLPPKARIEPSKLCEKCGEKTMQSKLEILEGKKICRGCAAVCQDTESLKMQD